MSYLLLTTGGTVQCGTGTDRRPQVELPAFSPAGMTWREKALWSEDSAYFTPAHWERLIEELDGFSGDGVLITHGTDTMCYTAAALSYAGAADRFPVVLTGAQLPPEEKGSDARKNLSDAARVLQKAAEIKAFGVYVVFDGLIWDGISLGKVNASEFSAFSSRMGEPIGRITGKMVTFFRHATFRTRIPLRFHGAAVEIAAYPGMDFAAADKCAENADGILLCGYGAGNFPQGTEDWIRKQTAKGKTVFLNSACPMGKLDCGAYHAGKTAADAGGYYFNITEESAFVLLKAAVSEQDTAIRKELISELRYSERESR